jgi:hypothetical protein
MRTLGRVESPLIGAAGRNQVQSAEMDRCTVGMVLQAGKETGKEIGA